VLSKDLAYKKVSKFTAKKFYEIDPWSQSYKTFFFAVDTATRKVRAFVPNRYLLVVLDILK
jgi:hypothetical protein